MKSLARFAAFSALGAVAASTPSAAWAELRGTTVEFGRTEGSTGSSQSKPDAGNGLSPAKPMYRTRYVDHSDRIEGRLCRSFGITVRISGTPMPDRVEVRVIHPRFTRPDGATSLEDDFPGFVDHGVTGVGFTFDNLWELEPGPWRIVVSAKGAELASQAFEVVLGSPRSDCPGATDA